MPERASLLTTPTTSAVHGVYERLAPLYDLLYGPMLTPGRRRAMARLMPRPGETILEVGVGTGRQLRAYPAGCRVVAIDLSASMLARAHARLRKGVASQVLLCQMDASHLAFAAGQFDAVYAPYVINVVPDPLAVAAEMRRVCRRYGRLVFLNHFEQAGQTSDAIDRIIGTIATRVTGVNWSLDLDAFIESSGLEALSVERVNVPQVSSVVVCRNA